MVITTTDIQLFQILKQKLGEKEAEALVNFVESKLKESSEANLKILATKEDIANLRAELKTDISNSKVDIIKWLVGTAVAIIGLLSGITFAMLNVYLKR